MYRYGRRGPRRLLIVSLADDLAHDRSASFKEDEGTWKGNDDGKVVNNQPQRVMDDRNGIGPQSGYIAKITNDAREGEMEENMGQVNTMIGNLRNMAIDMGSELENQNRQIDRINRKVSTLSRLSLWVSDAAPSPGKLGMASDDHPATRVAKIYSTRSLPRDPGGDVTFAYLRVQISSYTRMYMRVMQHRYSLFFFFYFDSSTFWEN